MPHHALVAALIFALGCGGLTAAEQRERTQAADVAQPAAGADSAQERARRGALKLATWNLEWLSRRDDHGPVKRTEDDYARLRAYAKRLDADVIALQEVDGIEAAARVFDPDEYALYMAAQNDPQRTGFAYRKALHVSINPDYAALDVGQVRVGADITVELQGKHLRLLSVHLKSGCFAEPLTSQTKDCRKLFAQLPSLEAWIDERAEEGIAAIVLGDFNRRLFVAAGDPFWSELDDSDPPLSDLWSPTEGQRARCWGGKYPDFIDHLVLNEAARELYVADSFEQLVYDARDEPHKRTLSDHCPLTIHLGSAGNRSAAPAATSTPSSAPPSAAPEQPTETRIKGNVGAGKRKLYHEPGCPDYARTQVDEGKGERWFASAAEAEAAGFQRAGNCGRR